MHLIQFRNLSKIKVFFENKSWNFRRDYLEITFLKTAAEFSPAPVDRFSWSFFTFSQHYAVGIEEVL